MAIQIRPLTVDDLPALLRVQSQSPGASQWTASDYEASQTTVAVEAGEVTGFVAWRPVAADELEILNLAVLPEWRRRGAGRALAGFVLAQAAGTVFLEVRESNESARAFYAALGFRAAGRRKDYYRNPPEAALVLRWEPPEIGGS